MSINGGLQVTVLLAGLATDSGNHLQLFFSEIRASFHHPRFTEILPGFGVIRGDSQRALVVTNPFVRATQFARGEPAIVPRFSRIAIFQ